MTDKEIDYWMFTPYVLVQATPHTLYGLVTHHTYRILQYTNHAIGIKIRHLPNWDAVHLVGTVDELEILRAMLFAAGAKCRIDAAVSWEDPDPGSQIGDGDILLLTPIKFIEELTGTSVCKLPNDSYGGNHGYITEGGYIERD